jgi:hypothetical protein
MHAPTNYCRTSTLVLKAQEEAFSSLNGIGHAKLGTMTTLVAVINTIVQEVTNDLQISLKFFVASPSPKLLVAWTMWAF